MAEWIGIAASLFVSAIVAFIAIGTTRRSADEKYVLQLEKRVEKLETELVTCESRRQHLEEERIRLLERIYKLQYGNTGGASGHAGG